MVRFSTVLTLGGLAAAYLIYKNLGGAAGIGSSIGSAFGQFTSGITQQVNRFGNLVETPQSNARNPAERVAEQLELGEYIIPSQEQRDPSGTLTAFEKSGLTFAGLEQQYNTAARIDLTTGERKSSYGVQPLDFIFDGSGGINTGRVGLSDSTLQAQQELSKKFGIPTFDTAGNLSTFAGTPASSIYGNYANPNFPEV